MENRAQSLKALVCALLVGTCMLLSGCTKSEKNAGIGAAIGGGTGLAIGAAAGGPVGAVAGGLVGAGAGAAIGSQVK